MDNNLIPILEECVGKAEKKLSYATATYFTNRGLTVDVDCKDEKIMSLPSYSGVVLSLFDGEKFVEYSTDRSDDEYLAKFCARAVGETKRLGDRYEIACEKNERPDYRTEEKRSPDDFSLLEKLEMCRQNREKMRRGKKVVNASAAYSENLSLKYFVNRHGAVRERIRRTKCALFAFVADGGAMKYNYLINGGTGGMEVVEVGDDAIAEVVDTAHQLLGAEAVKPGFYDVVMTPEVAGLVAHEAFGHGVETDMYLKDRARSRDYFNKAVASPLVSIVDDPTVPGAYGSYFIDDEGVTARPTVIVDRGKFIRGLTDRYSRTLLGLPGSANGRRASFDRKVYARMSNTFFKPGTDSKDDIIASVDDGIYLVKGMSGMEDPKGWGIQIVVLYGREIKHGRITGRLFSPVGVTGFVPDLLQSVSMVAGDLVLDSGYCGKGYKEYIPVATGGPHLKAKVRLG